MAFAMPLFTSQMYNGLGYQVRPDLPFTQRGVADVSCVHSGRRSLRVASRLCSLQPLGSCSSLARPSARRCAFLFSLQQARVADSIARLQSKFAKELARMRGEA